MQALLKNVETAAIAQLVEFSHFVASRHHLKASDVEKDVAAFLKGHVTADPKAMANKISSMTADESQSSDDGEIKTHIVNDDDASEAPMKQADASSSSSSDESEAPVPVPAPVPAKGKKSKKVKEPTPETSVEDIEIEAEESASSEEAPRSPPKSKGKGGKGKKPVVVEEEGSEASASDEGSTSASTKEEESGEQDSSAGSESEPPKKQAKGGKTSKPSKKVAKKSSPSLELSDTPKLPVKDRPAKLPKGVKFVKGTNNIVHNGVVVAALSKKGLVKLTNVNTKALSTKGIKFEVWDDAKIKKTFK